MQSCRVLCVQGMCINDQIIVFIFCIPYEQELIMNNNNSLTYNNNYASRNNMWNMQVYLLDLNASYVVVFTAPQRGWNILLRMSFHNIQRPVAIFVHGRDPLSSWQKFLIQFNHLWSSSKMEQGTTLSFLVSHRPFSNLSLKRATETPPGRHYS